MNNPVSQELELCPFCGSHATLLKRAIACDACLCDMRRAKGETDDQLVERWNRRIFAANVACVRQDSHSDGLHDPHYCLTHRTQYYGDQCPSEHVVSEPSAAFEAFYTANFGSLNKSYPKGLESRDLYVACKAWDEALETQPTLADTVLNAVDAAPVDMILHCPSCHLQHVDEPDERTPDWTNPSHRSHLCHGCGHIWRPADVPTNGVAAIKTKGKKDSAGTTKISERPGLTVWDGSMPESNGKLNFTAVLMRKDLPLFKGVSSGFTIAQSEYPDRVRYEADCVRYLIGELAEKPFILDYDTEKHSGYVGKGG